MKSLEVRIAGDQLIEEKIFPKKHFVVCSIITFFLFSLPSIYLFIIVNLLLSLVRTEFLDNVKEKTL